MRKMAWGLLYLRVYALLAVFFSVASGGAADLFMCLLAMFAGVGFGFIDAVGSWSHTIIRQSYATLRAGCPLPYIVPPRIPFPRGVAAWLLLTYYVPLTAAPLVFYLGSSPP